jgi:hypothetical protein
MNIQENWARHKWRRDTSWWDNLSVPSDVAKGGQDVFTWLDEVAPDPGEHDFILYTDGSGCDRGWGGYGAVIQRVGLQDEFRQILSTECLFGGTYGSTVQRCEMTALMDGVHRILTIRARELQDEAITDDHLRYELGARGTLSQLTGPDRVSILWFTDRANLAKSLLFNEDGDVLNARTTDVDLWLRWSAMARCVCVTPMSLPRNQIVGQAVCDALAGKARELLKSNSEQFTEPFMRIAGELPSGQPWNQPKKQTAPF